MFLWCFKCKDPDEEDLHQLPKTRNTLTSSSLKTHVTARDAKNGATPKSDEDLQQECLEAHNQYRAKHGVGPLALNKHLNALATEWAKHLANSNTLEHRKNCKYGENLYMGTGMVAEAHVLAVQAWYDEIEFYNFNRPGFSPKTGHFTQVIWKTSKELGVGVATSGNRTWVVCNYDPAGNVMGHFLDCVPSRIEEKVSKIIDKMKSQRKYMDWKKKSIENKKENAEQPSAAPVAAASDLKIWSKYELDCLNSHNRYRAQHGVPALKLNRNLCNLASNWSKNLAKSRTMSHRPNNKFGENIYYAMNFEPSADACVNSWYDEIKNYNFSKPGFSSQTGHFTQVVWKDSKELGVGLTQIDNMTFVVCNYSPAGNVMGQFQDQVLPAKAKAKISDNSNEITNRPAAESTFEDVCLDSHNSYRAIHGSPPLTLNKNLNFFAKDWAQHLAAQNKIESRKQNRFGENIFFAMDRHINGEEPVLYWYSGIQDFNFRKPILNIYTSNFTQIIWRSSTQLGVGVARNGPSLYVVCNYDPKGNIIEKFSENVLPIGGHSVQWYGKHQLPANVDIFSVNMLKFHNIYRKKHGSPDLKLSNELMLYAKKYVNHIIHNKPFPYAPNYVICLRNLKNCKAIAKDIVGNWYQEIEEYNFQRPQFTSETKHFTQLIWKGTHFMGVGVSERENNVMVAVSYEPAGNVENQYEENVPKLIES